MWYLGCINWWPTGYRRQRGLLRSSGQHEQEADPWTWHLTESSPRGQAGELLLLFEAKQGRGSGKTEAAAARLGTGDEDLGEDGVLWQGGDGLGLQERRGLSDELLLLDAARGRKGRREDRDETPGAEVIGAWRGSGWRGQLGLGRRGSRPVAGLGAGEVDAEEGRRRRKRTMEGWR